MEANYPDSMKQYWKHLKKSRFEDICELETLFNLFEANHFFGLLFIKDLI